MNKKFSRVLAVLLAIMMLVSSSPVSMVAYAVDTDPADYLTFNVTSGGNASEGTSVIIYSGSSEVASGVTNVNGIVEFLQLSDSQLATATVAVVGGYEVYGPLKRAVYYVDLTQSNTLENPQLKIEQSVYELTYGDRVSLNASSSSDASVVYEVVSGSEVVNVDTEGNIFAKAVGSATVRVSVEKTSKYEAAAVDVNITVGMADNAIVDFAKGDIPNAKKGQTYSNPAVLASDAVGTVTYVSDNEAFAVVDSQGNVKIVEDVNVKTEATITATFTSDDGNYATMSKSFVVSAECAINWEYSDKWVNGGVINVTPEDANTVVSYIVNGDNENVFHAPGGKIDIGVKEIPEGENVITVIVGSAKTNINVKKDTTAPTFKLDDAEDYWVNEVNISVNNLDDNISGVEKIVYSGKNFSETTAVDNKTDIALDNTVITDGNYTMTVSVYDRAGNKATKTVEIMKDSNADVLKVEHDPQAWLNPESEIRFSVEKGQSELASVEVFVKTDNELKNKKGAIELTDENNNEYVLDVSVLGLEDGDNTIVFKTVDAAKNETSDILVSGSNSTSTELLIKYDSKAPEFTINADNWFTSIDDSVEIVDLSDANSGLKAVYLLEQRTNARNELTTYSVPLSDIYFIDGKATITVIAVDNAGNETEKTAEIKFDDTAPVIGDIVIKEVGDDTASKTANKLTYGFAFNEGLSVSANVNDPESAVAKDNIVLVAKTVDGDEKTYNASSFKDGVATFNVPFEDFSVGNDDTAFVFKGTFTVKAVNGAGIETTMLATSNNSEGSSIISWENIKPDVEMDDVDGGTEITKEDGTTETWHSYEFNVPVEFSDSDSGVHSYEISVNDDVVYSFVAADSGAVVNTEKKLEIRFVGKDTSKEKSIRVDIFDVNTETVISDKDSCIAVADNNVYTLSVSVTDAAGNVETVSQSFNATASVGAKFNDNTPPLVITWLPESGDKENLVRYNAPDGSVWYNNDVTFNISVYDTNPEGVENGGVSGINSVNVLVNDSLIGDTMTWGEDPDIVTARMFEIKTDVATQFRYEYVVNDVRDNHGNSATDVSGTVFIDNINPRVTAIYYAEQDESDPSVFNKLINDLTFGFFFNDDVTVVVEGTDVAPEDSEDCSGVKEYVLYIGDKEQKNLKEVGRNENGIFEIDSDSIEGKVLYAEVIDNVGNKSDIKEYEDELNVDTAAPQMSLSVVIPENVQSYIDKEGKTWYSGDVDYKLDVTDNWSGIADVDVYLNNSLVFSESYNRGEKKVTKPETITVSTKDIVPNSDGSINFYYSITDNAGNIISNLENKKEGSAAFEYPETLYFDETAPGVRKIEFTELDDNASENAIVDVDFNKTSGMYDITCDKGTQIEITISDSGEALDANSASAGIEKASQVKVTFHPVDGSDAFSPNSGITFDLVENTNGTYVWTYIFTKDFKGNISVEITDNVGNGYKNDNPANFTIESAELHEDEKNHISIELDGYSDGVHFNHDVTPVIHIKDEYAGLASVGITVTAAGEKKEPIYINKISKDSRNLTIPEDGTDKNYVTKASIPVPVNYESDDVVIDVRIFDNAGNTSNAVYTFTVDKTAPVINCTLSSDATPVNSYYSSAVTASFTVEEHHFNDSTVNISEGVLSGWTPAGVDTFASSATYSSDGAHNVSMTVTDKAGNKTTYTVPQFYVDNTDPTITVTDLAHNEATNEQDVSFTITAKDALCLATNPLTTSFSVWFKEDDTTLVNKTLSLNDLVDMKFISVVPSSSTTEYSYKIDLTNAKDVFNDGIYALTCAVTDMSGRTSNTIICQTEDNASANVPSFMFSLNRMGSTYMVKWSGEDNSNVNALKNVDGSVTNAPSDIIIQEINPTEVNIDAVGTKITISDSIVSENVNVTPTVDTSKKYSVYTYKVARDSYFDVDGKYELRMETVDAAGNSSDGSSKNFLAATFTVDTSVPVINTELQNRFEQNVETYRTSVEFVDISDCTVDILVNEQPVNVYLENAVEPVFAKGLKLSGDSKVVYFDLSDVDLNVQITVNDGLNDPVTVTYTDINISDSAVKLLFATLNQNPWIYIIIVGVPVAIAAIIIILKKKKNDDFADEKKSKKAKK